MKQKLRSLVAATLIGLGSLTQLSAQDVKPAEPPVAQEKEITKEKSSITANTQTDFLSKYIFRGFSLSDKPIFQNLTTIGYKNFSVTSWSYFNTQSKEADELHFILDYTKAGEKGWASFGSTLFTYPTKKAPNTQEVYLAGGLNTKIAPSLFALYDFNEGKGSYAETSLSYTLPRKKWSLESKATVAYNHHYFREQSGFSHAQADLKAVIPLTDRISITPQVSYQHSLDRRSFRNEVFGGIGLNILLR